MLAATARGFISYLMNARTYRDQETSSCRVVVANWIKKESQLDLTCAFQPLVFSGGDQEFAAYLH